MKFNFVTPLSAAMVLWYGATASALPYVNPSCGNGKSLTIPQNGKGVYYSEDCSTAYVEPPVMGNVELRAIAPTQNLQFCEAVGQVDEIATRTVNTIGELSKKLEQMVKDYEPLDKALSELRVQAETARARSEKAKRDFTAAEKEIEILKTSLRKALEAKEDCHLRNPGATDKCQAEDTAAANADKAYAEYRLGAYKQARQANDDALGEYDELNARLTESNKRYSEAIAPMIELWNSISDLNSKAFDMYKQYAGLNGATGQLVYSIDWNKLVTDFEAANPSMRGHFMPIPIREGTVWGSVVPRGTQSEATIPAVLSTEIPGLRPAGLQGIGKGDKVEPAATAPSPTLDGGVIQSVSGQVVLTLNGACPFFKSPTEPAKNISMNNLAAYLVLNTTFSYEVAAKRGYKAEYHLSQLMSRFERKAKKGGFFSSKTVHEVIEDNQSDDWFKFKAYSEDSQYAYTDQQEQELKNTVKAELIDRALKQVAVFNSGGVMAPGLIAPGRNGAQATSAALRQCPLWYCQAGSLVFGVLDSIFGRSEAVSNFRRNNNVWITEDVSGVRMVNRAATVTFAPPKG